MSKRVVIEIKDSAPSWAATDIQFSIEQGETYGIYEDYIEGVEIEDDDPAPEI